MKTKLVSLITFILLSAVSAKAQMCANLFDGAKIQGKEWIAPSPYVPHTNQLSPAKLAKYKLGLSEDKMHLINYDTVDGKPEVLGKLLISDAEYLFEWASKKEHNEWMRAKGISKDHMNAILSDSPQLAGKGFYVSLDPADSSNYGETVTVFRTKAPVVILEFFNPSDAYESSTAKVKNLSAAGIDAIRYDGYTKNWLSVISHRQLQKPGGGPTSVFMNIFEDSNDVSLFKLSALTKFPKYMWKKIPSSDPFRRLVLGDEMTLDQIELVNILFTSTIRIYKLGSNNKVQQNYLLQIVRHTLQAKDANELLRVLKLLEDVVVDSENIVFMKELLRKLNPNPKYSVVLDQPKMLRKHIAVPVIKSWIELAKDEDDFSARSRIAIEMFYQAFPESKP